MSTAPISSAPPITGPSTTAPARAVAAGGPVVETTALDALVALAAETAGLGTKALLTLVGPGRDVQCGTFGLDADLADQVDAMCAVVLHDTAPVVVGDARYLERFEDRPWVTAGAVRFWASFPLQEPGGSLLGSLCLFDDRPREVDGALRRRLGVVATRVAAALSAEQLAAAVAEREVHRLRAEREHLARANADLAGFAARVAHDLVNPLASLRLLVEHGHDELRVPRPDVDAVAGLLERAERSIDRIADTLTGLLGSAGRPGGLQATSVDLAQVLREATEDLGDPGDTGLDVHACGDLPVVSGDAVHLRLLLQNLLGNAAKHNRAAPGRTRVEVSAERRPGGWHVRVADGGVGLEPALHAEVLRPRTRGPAAVGVPGLGLGLAICQRAAEQHGGALGLETTPGGGLTVWFDLPDPR